jgi:type III secretion protein L
MADPAPETTNKLPRGPGFRILRSLEAAAWQDGFRFLAEAGEQAERLKQAARRTAAAEQARGFEQGRAAGAADAARLVSETAVKVDHYLASIEQQIADLATAIARRVLGDFDAADLVARAAAQAVSDFRREKWVKLTVHPDAVERVRAALGRGAGDLGPIVTVEADPAREPTSCVLISEFAVVDASIDTQLSAISADTRLAAVPVGTAGPESRG